jgi:hypothetical protein
MKRWLFNILAALSSLVFAATAVLWVRSYYGETPSAMGR